MNDLPAAYQVHFATLLNIPVPYPDNRVQPVVSNNVASGSSSSGSGSGMNGHSIVQPQQQPISSTSTSYNNNNSSNQSQGYPYAQPQLQYQQPVIQPPVLPQPQQPQQLNPPYTNNNNSTPSYTKAISPPITFSPQPQQLASVPIVTPIVQAQIQVEVPIIEQEKVVEALVPVVAQEVISVEGVVKSNDDLMNVDQVVNGV